MKPPRKPMNAGLRLALILALLAWGYAMIAVIQLPNASSMDGDPVLEALAHGIAAASHGVGAATLDARSASELRP